MLSKKHFKVYRKVDHMLLILIKYFCIVNNLHRNWLIQLKYDTVKLYTTYFH